MSDAATLHDLPVRIRDVPVRLAHWGLVVSVTGSFWSHYAGTSAFAWHVRFGCATLLLAAFRIAWGFVGTRYARFAPWLRTALRARGPGDPAAVTRAGSLMALALLALLLTQALSGLFANDDMMDAGPLSGAVARSLSNALSSTHEVVSSVLLVVLALHVGAALVYRIVLKDDRITPLVTGKRAGLPAGSALRAEQLWRACLVAFALAAVLGLALALAPEPIEF